MAVRRYVLTATVIIPGGTHAPGSPAVGHHGPAGPGSATTRVPHSPPATCLKGQVAVLDPDSAAYAAIGGEHLRPFIEGRDHLEVACRVPGCRSAWCRPRHEPSTGLLAVAGRHFGLHDQH
jgi:hypothetical protein